jgi:glycosyltransferase involved in cell wall biosynthesis
MEGSLGQDSEVTRLPVRRRILFVTSNFPRWAGDSTTPFVQFLARDLIDLGWQVDVLAPHAPGAAEAEVLGGVPVERFRYLFPESAQTVCYQGGALANLDKNPLNKLKLPALVLAEWLAVQQRALSGAYDLIHSHWVLPQGFVGMLAAGLCGLPHVITVHGSDIFLLTSPLLESAKRAAFERARVVTVNSSVTEARTREVAPELSDLRRIPMGIEDGALSSDELTHAAALRRRFRGERGPLLVFVGRMVAQKGGEDLLRAVALLSDELPDLRLLMLGEGPDRAGWERLADELGVASRVTFLGWVDPSEVRAHLAAADMIVGPSRGTEAQGLAFLEAMSAGTAVVAARSGGVLDVVHHERTGLLVSQEAPAELARAIARLSLDETLRSRLVVGARELLHEGFSRWSSARRFSEIYTDCLGSAV